MSEERSGTSTTQRDWRYAAAVIWITTATAFTTSFAGSLFSTSADLGHHAVLISRLMEGWTLPDVDENLQYMTSYPRGAHLLGSMAGLLSGSAVHGMQIVAIMALFSLWSAIGLGLAGLSSGKAMRATALVAIALLLNAFVGLELFGSELISNYFFAHMVSQSLAVVALVVALRIEFARARTLAPYLMLGGAAPLLTSVHLLPAIELLGALAILVVANSCAAASRPAMRELAVGSSIVIASTCLTIANPAFVAMYQVSGHEGSTLLKFIPGIPSLLAVAAITVLVSSGLLAVWWRRRADAHTYSALLAKYFGAFGLSIAGLCVMQMLMHALFGIGSQYACFKYAIGLQSLLVVNSALLAAQLWKADGPASTGFQKAIIPSALATCAVLTLFLRHVSVPAHALVTAEKDAREFAGVHAAGDVGKQDIAVDIQGVPQTGSYVISRTSLRNSDEWMLYEILQGRLPNNLGQIKRVFTSPGSDAWDVRACRTGTARSLVVLDGACVIASMSSVPCAGAILFSSSGAFDRIASGFSAAEPNGRWSIGGSASVQCKVEGVQPTKAYLSTIGLVTESHRQRMSVSVNGGAPVNVEYSAHSPSHIVAIPLPAQPASGLVFSFSFPDAISPEALGMSSDTRELAVKMHSLRFE